ADPHRTGTGPRRPEAWRRPGPRHAGRGSARGRQSAHRSPRPGRGAAAPRGDRSRAGAAGGAAVLRRLDDRGGRRGDEHLRRDGGMGVVYAAEDQRLGRMVAIKALPPEYTRDPARRARLTREARAAAALSHPAIATIYTLEETADGLYIVGELVRGRTLREELGDGPLPASRLVPTLLDIAGALDAAHRI